MASRIYFNIYIPRTYLEKATGTGQTSRHIVNAARQKITRSISDGPSTGQKQNKDSESSEENDDTTP